MTLNNSYIAFASIFSLVRSAIKHFFPPSDYESYPLLSFDIQS